MKKSVASPATRPFSSYSITVCAYGFSLGRPAKVRAHWAIQETVMASMKQSKSKVLSGGLPAANDYKTLLTQDLR